jgi:hypothetical protein
VRCADPTHLPLTSCSASRSPIRCHVGAGGSDSRTRELGAALLLSGALEPIAEPGAGTEDPRVAALTTPSSRSS